MIITVRAHESKPPVRFFDLTTAQGIANERPLLPATVFSPDQEVIYLWYAAEGCEIGTAIRSVWQYLETDPPFRLADASVVVEQAGTWGQFNFRLAPGKRWAMGRYRIELWVGNELIASTYFEVSPRTTLHFQAGIPAARRNAQDRLTRMTVDPAAAGSSREQERTEQAAFAERGLPVQMSGRARDFSGARNDSSPCSDGTVRNSA
jgi:hypothetical protein